MRFIDPSGYTLCDKGKEAFCPFVDLKLDITSWPDWLYNLTGGACYLIGCAVENNTLRTLTPEEQASTFGLDFAAPIGAATRGGNRALTRAGRNLIEWARGTGKNPLRSVRPIAKRMAGATKPYYDMATGQGIYVLIDKTGKVRYVGRGDVYDRIAEHACDPIKGTWEPFIVAENNLLIEEARGLEQLLIEHYGNPKYYGGVLENDWRGINYRSKNFNKYVDAATPLYKEAVEMIEAFRGSLK
jgi:hypothetical protein